MANYATQCRICGSYFSINSATNLCYSCLEKKLRREEAEAAAMREALKQVNLFVTNGIAFGYILMPDPCTNDPALDIYSMIHKALSSTAGKDLLERVRGLEAVVETAKRPCIECVLSHHQVNSPIPCEVEIDPDCMFWPIRQAWTALEGGK